MSKEPGVIYPGHTTFDSEIIITEPITNYLVEHDCTYKFNGKIWGYSQRGYRCNDTDGNIIDAGRHWISAMTNGITSFDIQFDKPFTGTISLFAVNTHIANDIFLPDIYEVTYDIEKGFTLLVKPGEDYFEQAKQKLKAYWHNLFN